jgi:hypothetical protein
MKKRILLLASAALLAGFVVPSRAADDDGPLEPGRWMPDITAYNLSRWDGNLHFERLAKAQPGGRVAGWWWQRTTNQESIIDTMNGMLQAYPNLPRNPIPKVHYFGSPESGVMVPSTGTQPAGGTPIPDVSGGPANAVIVEADNYTILIGPGGNTSKAELMINYIKTNIPGKPLRWLIIPDVSATSLLDASVAAKYATAENPLTVIMSLDLLTALNRQNSVYATNVYPPNWSTVGQRTVAVNGGLPTLPAEYKVPRDLNWRLAPPYSGTGSPLLCPTVPPFDKIPPTPNVNCIYVPTPTLTLNLQNVEVKFTQAIEAIGGLTTYFPQQQLLVAPSLFGGYLPDLAPLTGPVIPSSEVLQALTTMLDVDMKYFVGLNVPWIGQHPDPAINKPRLFIQTQADVLLALQDYTMDGLKNNVSLEDLVAGVSLPQTVLDKCAVWWPFSPCSELHSSLGQVVRGIYNEYVGWFDGSARSLGTHLSTQEQAQILVDAAGGVDRLLNIAKTTQTAAQDLKSVEKALMLIEPLYELYPDNATVRVVYYQALYKAGLMQENTQLRNYYLTLAWMVRPTN